MTLAERIASAAVARKNCEKNSNNEWERTHEATLVELENNKLPSGSGLDSGVTIDRELTSSERLVMISHDVRIADLDIINEDG